MELNREVKQRLALVLGTLPTPEEVDQFVLLAANFDIAVISMKSICGYLEETSRFDNLHCLALPDYDDNPTFIPGLEKVLSDFDVVVVKERIGLYAYQAVKAKWRNEFKLVVWVDNLAAFAAEDVNQMRTIRNEVTKAADAFIVQTDAARNTLMLEGVDNKKIFKFRPWVARTVEQPKSKKNRAKGLEALCFNEGSFVLAHFGQIEWEEGLVDLALAVKQAIQKNAFLDRELKLVFCGIGSYMNQLHDLVISLGLEERSKFVSPSREAFEAIYYAADCIYYGSNPSRDRVEGEPYRVLSAMANDIPLVASRNPLIEEICGKHRIDFCSSSLESLADAIIKTSEAKALVNDIVKKNAATIQTTFSKENVEKEMISVFAEIMKLGHQSSTLTVDRQIVQVEALVLAKDYLKAIDVIEAMFKLENLPVHHKSNLYRLIGDCFAKLGDNDSAKSTYIKSIELDPYSAKAFIGLGTVALVKGIHDIAVIHFQKAVSLAPEDEMANLGLGLAFQGMDELNEASKWVAKSLSINPENTVALFTFVRLAFDRDVFENVEEILRRYLQNNPRDTNILFSLAGVLFKQNKPGSALEIVEDLLKINANDERALSLADQIRSSNSTMKANNI